MSVFLSTAVKKERYTFKTNHCVIDHAARISYDVATNQVWLQGIFNKFKFARRNFRYGAADDTYGRSIYTGTTFEQLSK